MIALCNSTETKKPEADAQRPGRGEGAGMDAGKKCADYDAPDTGGKGDCRR